MTKMLDIIVGVLTPRNFGGVILALKLGTVTRVVIPTHIKVEVEIVVEILVEQSLSRLWRKDQY